MPTGRVSEHFNGMLTLNETSRFLWELFRMPHTFEETVAAAQERYEDDNQSLESDIYDFMKESVMLGISERGGVKYGKMKVDTTGNYRGDV